MKGSVYIINDIFRSRANIFRIIMKTEPILIYSHGIVI